MGRHTTEGTLCPTWPSVADVGFTTLLVVRSLVSQPHGTCVGQVLSPANRTQEAVPWVTSWPKHGRGGTSSSLFLAGEGLWSPQVETAAKAREQSRMITELPCGGHVPTKSCLAPDRSSYEL